jgi:hypothetical protein
MKTQKFNYKALSLTLILAFLFSGSQKVLAQDVDDVEETTEIIIDTDTNTVKKIIKGKRIKIIIATKEDGKDDTHEIVIDLPENISEADAENIERALEKAGEAMEGALEDALEIAEEALEAAEDAMEHKKEVEKHVIISKGDGDHDGHKHHIVIDHDHIKKTKKPKLVETSWNVIELGINEMLIPDNASLPAAYSKMDIVPAKSINFHWGIVQQGINIGGGKLRLLYGLGIDFNNYRFKEDIDLTEGSDPLAYTENSDRDYKKNKLVAQYLTMPLMLNFKSNPKNENKSLNLAAGIHAGYLIQSHQKQKWQEDGSKQKSKIRGDYQLNEYRLGYAIQFGYGDVNIYGHFYPDPIFKDGKGPELNTAAVGIVIMPF